MLKKLGNGSLVVVGYLLSPLCWWNDLFFNLPIAYGFGHICNFFVPESFFPASIVGYWISNIAGILLMQFGTVELLQNSSESQKSHNFRKNLLVGIASSTLYTIAILALLHFKILDTPFLFSKI